MRNLKRVLSLALALVMMLGMMIITSSAAEAQTGFADADDIEYVEAAEVLNAIGVIEGIDQGSDRVFDPDGILTREQAAAIISRLLLGEANADKLGTNTQIFVDVAAGRWSAGYIAYCANLGIIAGDGAGSFDPEGQLTGVAFAKMLLVALGYDAKIEGYVNDASWATNIAVDALAAGIDVDGITLDSPVNRDNACQMAFNTLQANTVMYSQKTEVNTGDATVTVSGGRYDVSRSNANDYRGGAESSTDGYQQFCEKYFPRLTCATDYNDAGRPGTQWTYKGDPAVTIDTLLAGTVVDVYKNINGVVTRVVALNYTLAVIDEIDTDVAKSDAKKGVSAYVTLVGLDGATAVGNGVYNDNDIIGFNTDAYVEGAKIAVALNGNSDIVDSHVTATVTGTVSAWSSGGRVRSVTIGGDKYTRNANEDDQVGSGNFSFNKDQYAVYLDANEFVLGVEGISDLKLSDLYYVYGAYYTNAANGDATNYVLTVNMEGEVAEYRVEDNSFTSTLNITKKTTGTTYNSLAPNTFLKIDTTNNGATLFTLSDKIHDGTDNFANNGKYTLTKVNDGSGADYDTLYVTEIGDVALTDHLTSSSTSIGTISGSDFAKAYLEETTKFILIDETTAPSANIRVTTAEKATRVNSSVSEIQIIASKVGNSYVAERVIVVDDDIASGVTNINNVVYLTGTSSTKVGNKLWQWKGYFMDATNADINVEVSSNGSDYSEGFYTFEINEDGNYELTSLSSTAVYGTVGSLAAGFAYEDETGYVPDTTVASIYNGTITLSTITDNSNTATFDDVALADDLVIIDNRGASARELDLYTLEINTLAKLQAAMKKGTVTVASFVDDGEMLFISVTAAQDDPAKDTSITVRACLKSFDKIGAKMDNKEKKQAGDEENASIPK